MSIYYVYDKRNQNLYKVIGRWYNVVFDVCDEICRNSLKEGKREIYFQSFCSMTRSFVYKHLKELLDLYMNDKEEFYWFVARSYPSIDREDYVVNIHVTVSSKGRSVYGIYYKYLNNLYDVEFVMEGGEFYRVIFRKNNVTQFSISKIEVERSKELKRLKDPRNFKTLLELHEFLVSHEKHL